jgi:thiol:disulfide interchange protein
MKLVSAVVLIGSTLTFALFAQDKGKPEPQSHTFDSTRDAAAEIEKAVAEAQQTGKRIILDIGGDWCPYCRALDQLYQDHPDLLQLRDANFIVVNVYYGADKKNEQALSHYSKVLGIPHFFVLNSDGTLLHSQHVLDLKADGNYSPVKMKEFLSKWSNANK